MKIFVISNFESDMLNIHKRFWYFISISDLKNIDFDKEWLTIAWLSTSNKYIFMTFAPINFSFLSWKKFACVNSLMDFNDEYFDKSILWCPFKNWCYTMNRSNIWKKKKNWILNQILLILYL